MNNAVSRSICCFEGGRRFLRDIVRAVLVRGIPVSVCGMLLTAALLSVSSLPVSVCPLLAGLPLLAGSFFSGLYAARRRRRGGIFCGTGAALLLTALWYLLCCLLTGGLRPVPGLLLTVFPFGICGGIFGTGLRQPPPRPRSHRLPEMQTRAALRRALLHKPKQSFSAGSDAEAPAGLQNFDA